MSSGSRARARNHRAKTLANPACGEKSIIAYINAFRNARKPADATASSTHKPQAINSSNSAAKQALKALQSSAVAGGAPVTSSAPPPRLPARNSTKKASAGPTKAADSGTVLYDSLPATATAAEADKPNPNDIYAVVPAKESSSKVSAETTAEVVFLVSRPVVLWHCGVVTLSCCHVFHSRLPALWQKLLSG